MLIDPYSFAVAVFFGLFAGWLLADDEAHLTEDLRNWLARKATNASNRAATRLYTDGETRRNRFRYWRAKKISSRLSCRICMAFEWIVFAWATLSDPVSRWESWESGILYVVEIAALNGAHLVLVKFTTPKAGTTDGVFTQPGL